MRLHRCSMMRISFIVPDNLTIELTQEEAFYLDKQIQKSTKGSLLEYVLKNHIDLNEYDDFASLTAELSEKVSEKLAYMMKLACDFNNLVYMARVREIRALLLILIS